MRIFHHHIFLESKWSFILRVEFKFELSLQFSLVTVLSKAIEPKLTQLCFSVKDLVATYELELDGVSLSLTDLQELDPLLHSEDLFLLGFDLTF